MKKLAPSFLFLSALSCGFSGPLYGAELYDPTVVVRTEVAPAPVVEKRSVLPPLVFFGPHTPSEGSSPWAINLHGFSYHVKRPTDLNERNWGLGVRYYHDALWGGQWYSETNAAYNSMRGIAATVGTGLDYTVLRMGDFAIHAEGQIAAVYYSYKDRHAEKDGHLLTLHHNPQKGVLPLVQFTLQWQNVSFAVTPVPRRSLKEMEVYIFHFMYRF